MAWPWLWLGDNWFPRAARHSDTWMSLCLSSSLLQCWECSPRVREVQLWDGCWELARAWFCLHNRRRCSTGAKGEAAATSRVGLGPWQRVSRVTVPTRPQPTDVLCVCGRGATCHPQTRHQSCLSPETLSCRSWAPGLPPAHLCLPLLKSIRECSNPGRSWHVVPVLGSSTGRRPHWGVSKTCRSFGSSAAAPGCAGQPLLLQGVQEFCLSSQMIPNNMSPAPCCELGGSSQLPLLTLLGPGHGLGVTWPGTRAFLPTTIPPHPLHSSVF